MTTLSAHAVNDTFLSEGKNITVTADAEGSALIQRYIGYDNLIDATQIGNSESVTLGEYSEDIHIKVSCLSGTVTISESQSTESRGLSASTSELNEYSVFLDIADGSAEETYYVICPHAGTIKSIMTVIDGAVSTADITITGKIGATTITDGVITIGYSTSAAGDIDTQLPSANNVVTAGQAVNFTVTGGGAGGSPRIHLAMTITR